MQKGTRSISKSAIMQMIREAPLMRGSYQIAQRFKGAVDVHQLSPQAAGRLRENNDNGSNSQIGFEKK